MVVTVPLPSTRPIHPGWADHHRPTSDASMNATVTITNGLTGGGWDPTNGPTEGVPIVTYTGRARITYEPVRPGTADAVGQDITTRTVTVALPRDAAEQAEGARIHVDAVDANGPTGLVGRDLTVGSTAYSSHALEQVLTATDDQTNQPDDDAEG